MPPSDTLSSYWNIFALENFQEQKTGTAAATMGIGAVGATYPHVELHSYRSDIAGHLFVDGMGIS